MYEAETNKGLITQMEKINVPEVVIKAKRTEIAGCLVVAKILMSIQSETVG